MHSTCFTFSIKEIITIWKTKQSLITTKMQLLSYKALFGVGFQTTQDKFLNALPGKRVLDFGCGSGRDTKYFLGNGLAVTAMDGSEELCKYASAYTGIPVKT